MKYLLLAAALLVGGCSGPSTIKTEVVRTYPSGVVEKVKTSLKGPEYALEGSSLDVTTNGVYGSLSAAQDVKGIEEARGESAKELEEAKGDNISKKIVYGGLALILLLSIVALFLPDTIVSKKDALTGFACALAGFVIVRYVEASAPVMKWVIPLAALGGGIYLFVMWRRGRIATK